MIRLLLSTTAAALLLAAPLTANAATKPMKSAHHATMAKPVATKPMKHGAKPNARRQSAGDAEVDKLNEQSLAKARSGQ